MTTRARYMRTTYLSTCFSLPQHVQVECTELYIKVFDKNFFVTRIETSRELLAPMQFHWNGKIYNLRTEFDFQDTEAREATMIGVSFRTHHELGSYAVARIWNTEQKVGDSSNG